MPEQEEAVKAYIDQVKKDGDTIGGIVETLVGGVGFLVALVISFFA